MRHEQVAKVMGTLKAGELDASFVARVLEAVYAASVPVFDFTRAQAQAVANNGSVVVDARMAFGLAVSQEDEPVVLVDLAAFGGIIYWGVFDRPNTALLYSATDPGALLMPLYPGANKTIAISSRAPYLHVAADAASGTSFRAVPSSYPVGAVR